MAQVSGSVRVFVMLALFLLKVTLAVRDPLNDPSLEIIRQQDAEEGLTQGYQDPNAIPCRDPTPINGALEVVSGVPFLINSIVVKIKCLNGLVFRDGTTEKTERCFGAPTPLRMTGIWSPDQEIFVCQEPKNKTQNVIAENQESNKSRKRFLETLLCANPKTPNNKIKVIKGEPNHLYSTIEVSCPPGSHFNGGQEVINVTCLPLPDPCYCRAAWETLDQYNLIYDFNCTVTTKQPTQDNTNTERMVTPDSKPVPCYDPTPTNGAMKVLSGTPFVISNVTVKVMCLNGLRFPDGTTEKTATCLPASTPYHVTGVWTPPFGPLKCEDKPPKRNANKRFLESVVCEDPKTPDNTVTIISGQPLAMGSKVEVTCNDGRHFPNGLSRVNVTCSGLPDPCMCRAAWQTVPGYNLMYSFNCTALQPPISVSEGGDTSHASQEQASMTEEGDVMVTNTDDVHSEGAVKPENIDTPKQLPNHIPVNFVENSNKKDKTDNQLQDIEQETANIKINGEQTKSNGDSEEKLTDTSNEDEGELQSLNEKVNPIPQTIIEGVEEQEETNDFDGESEIIGNASLKDKEHLGNGEEVNEYDDVENRINKYVSVESPASNKREIPENIAEEDEEEEIRLTNAAEESNTDETEIELEPETEEYEKEIEIEETDNEDNNFVNTIQYKGEQEIEEGDEEEEEVVAEETVSDDEEEDEEEEEEEEEEDETESEEPPEEEWGTESEETYHESQSEIEQTTGPVISLAESIPVNQHNMIYNVVEDSREVPEEEQHTDDETDSNGAYIEEGEEYEEEEEEIYEEPEEHEESEQEQEEYSQDEESNIEPEEETEEVPEEHDTEEGEVDQSDEGTTEESHDSESDEELPDQAVEPPAPLHEIQNSPFFRDADVVEIDEGELDTCTLRPDSGVGRQVHTRYYYDTTSGECTRFVYGGSGGNNNNFEDIYTCIETCYRQRS